MRAGLCAVPQALTVEAASIVKQAVNLAKRRGHAQVTPLHVATAMLACPTGLLRRACTHHSHSHHPLQWKALELCFNVALNRLPASTITSPLLGPHHHSPRPSLSNALVAAFKRAQAHQRRGSIENQQQQQQQPVLALKIEVEQLVISILDDPSVSRVMREAGFSSSQVKIKVEENVPLGICSQSTNKSLGRDSDDVMSVLNALINKKRNTVIVGGNLAAVEGVIRGIIDQFERGQVPGDLRYAQFISLPLFSFRNQSKGEVEQKLVELRCHVKSYMGRGIVLYLGDLKWVAEFWANYYGGDEQKRNNNNYCVEEYVIMEIKRLVFEIGESERVWIMGIASFQTYTRCKAGHPSLENMWKLHPFTIPVGSLSLSLNIDSFSDSPPTHQFITTNKVQRDGLISWPLLESGAEHLNHLNCSSNVSVNYFNREGQSMATSSIHKKKSAVAVAKSTLPSWLQQYKEESRRNSNMINDNQDLCEKWNSFGNKQTHFSSSSPSSISVSSRECKQLLPKEHQFWVCEGYESSLRSNHHPKPDLLSNPNSSPNSASSSEAEEEDSDCLNSFNKFTDENLKVLSDALERKAVVPWQKEIMPEIARTILECRSKKEQTWLLFLGADDHNHGKEKIAREIAKVVFGSHSNNFTNLSSSQSRQDDCRTKKRSRDDELGCCSYTERLGLALNENPHRVFFMEDLDDHKVDSCYCQKGLKQAIENGCIALADGEIVPLKDSIIIFSCDNLDSVPSACSHQNKRPKTEEKDDDCNLSLDLNIAIEDEDDRSVGDIRNILESVDKQIIFKTQQLR